jgi:hypothetical protein
MLSAEYNVSLIIQGDVERHVLGMQSLVPRGGRK